MKKYCQLFLIFSFLFCMFLSGKENKQEIDHCKYGVPAADQTISRKGYALGYGKDIRLSRWTGYILQKRNLTAPQVKRRNKFKADLEIRDNPVVPSDYLKTGYDRGHMVPAADMTYSEQTAEESFYMTNIVPQLPGCNRGIWKELEGQVRKWAIEERELYVFTGPVFTGPEDKLKKLGKTDIPIPTYFYKVLYDLTPPRKMIAFLIPNKKTTRQLESFIVSVDEVERLTGLNFFSALSPEEELMLEAISNIKAWKMESKRKNKR